MLHFIGDVRDQVYQLDTDGSIAERLLNTYKDRTYTELERINKCMQMDKKTAISSMLEEVTWVEGNTLYVD